MERPGQLGYRDFSVTHRDQVPGLHPYIQFNTPFISYYTDRLTIANGRPLKGIASGIAAGYSVVNGMPVP